MHATTSVIGTAPLSSSLAETLARLVELIEHQSPGMLGSVLLLDGDGRLRHGAAPSLPDAYNEAIDGFAVGPAVGSCGTAAFRKERVIVSDTFRDPLWADFRDLACEHELRACWSTPVLGSGGEVLGTFALYYREPRSPTPQDLELIDSAVRLAATAIEHDLTQEALRESEERYRTLFDSIDEGFCIVKVLFDEHGNPVDYRFLEINPCFEKQTGFERAVGKRIRELAPNLEEHWFQTYGRVALTGEPIRFENRAAALQRWYDVYAFRVGEPDEHKVAILFDDITERKRAEEEREFLLELSAALQQEREPRALALTASRLVAEHLDAARAYLVEVDEENRVACVPDDYRRPDLPPLPRSRSFDEMPPAILEGVRDGMAVVNDTASDPRTAANYLAAYEPMRVGSLAAVGLRREGRWVASFVVAEAGPRVWTEAEVALVRASAERIWPAFEAARARRETEEARIELETERNRLRTIFEQAPAIIAVLRGPEHVYEVANPLYLRLIGNRDILRKPIAEALPEIGEQGFIDLLNRVYRSGEPYAADGVPVLLDRRGDGRMDEVFLNFVYQPLFEADGSVSGIFVHGVDVTEQVRSRQEAERAREEAQEANRVKAEFLATMSHELRTPLNAILGYADLLLMGVPEPIPDSSTEQVARIQTSARHLLQLIEEILSFSRVEAGREEVNLETVDIFDLVRETGALVEPLARQKDLGFSVQTPERRLDVETDAPKVRQMLFNLLSNAVKFTDAGEVRVDAMVEKESVIIEVIDAGIGIPAEQQERIFEPFRQLRSGSDRRESGTGLGLAVTRRLAQLLGGDVTVESALGEGSTFTLRLPVPGETREDP